MLVIIPFQFHNSYLITFVSLNTCSNILMCFKHLSESISSYKSCVNLFVGLLLLRYCAHTTNTIPPHSGVNLILVEDHCEAEHMS